MRLIPTAAIAASLFLFSAAAAETPSRPAGPITSLDFAMPEWKRPLPISLDEARLVGEAVSREFPLFITTAEATRPAMLRLAYLNAISVMPETFKLTVRVNDVVVGDTVVQNASEPETLSLAIPPGLLEPGFNAVRVSVRQTHRVDCSVESTYELWTRVLTEQSDLVFTGARGEIRQLRDLPAVKPDRNGLTPIRIRIPGGLESASIERASRAAQAVVLLGRYSNPVVEIDPDQAMDAGLDVVIGTLPVVERALGIRIPGSGPQSILIHDQQSGRVTLVVTGATETEIDAALEALTREASGAALHGSAAGLRALKNVNGRLFGGGETVNLAELGLESEPFRGRLYRQTFRLQLPSDLLVADYDRLTLAIDAAYASALSPESKMVVRVNGAPIADIAMANPAGDVLSRRMLYLPVRAFKPGLNTVDIEAETRTQVDETCEIASLADQRERYLLLGTSEITVPALARIGTLPNISSIVPGGLTHLSASKELHVFVPKARREAIAASLTMLAKIASVSRIPTKAKFTFDRMPEGADHVLAFGAYDDMPEATVRAAGLDPAKLGKIGPRLSPDAPRIGVVAKPIQVAFIGDEIHLSPSDAEPKDVQRSLPSSSLIQLAEAAREGSGLLGAVKSVDGSDLMGHARSAVDWIRNATAGSLHRAGILGSQTTKGIDVTEDVALVVAQGARTKELEAGLMARLLPSVETTTVILAPTADRLKSSLSDILASSHWQQFVGQAAVYKSQDAAVETQVSERILLVPTAPLDIQNVRLIIAGWLSRNSAVHITGLLGILLVLTFALHRVLRLSGVRE
ncbi:cellulose biosynthesis cyclic di-GMP-binding regulatory protein BcsB [Microvirga roseola]|uniref:cellulose biosynthesis cyclic di-GMP-binding regulatory protein BcsB n=1 Tax=Microvirga roseola TaxID=2883126 RepID=UPI001E45ECC9|nr:cellulose biosynthesis cyclic di-GMP-binding regulatory protein BcsB [Microvirga roseola]